MTMMPPPRSFTWAVDKEIECSCGWKGTIKECTEKYEDSIGFLSGRKAYLYYCPKCENLVHEDVLVMS